MRFGRRHVRFFRFRGRRFVASFGVAFLLFRLGGGRSSFGNGLGWLRSFGRLLDGLFDKSLDRLLNWLFNRSFNWFFGNYFGGLFSHWFDNFFGGFFNGFFRRFFHGLFLRRQRLFDLHWFFNGGWRFGGSGFGFYFPHRLALRHAVFVQFDFADDG